MADRMEGQVALVTGGGRGIGAGIARELADAGMKVAVSARTPEQVQEVADEIGGLAVVADVSSKDAVEAMVEQVERELCPIDLLVNNAGIADWGDKAWESDPDEWWRVFEINVLGPFLVTRAVIPGMIERGRGRIVNTGSGSGYLPGQATTAYGGSKAALYRMGEGLAQQLEPYGIPASSRPR
jgi:NAD(P)-dependent dehydrogenase (short-subunit alcohol dehydrogenase family)